MKEEKIKKNAQIVFEILEEKGVKAAPKRAKEEEVERIKKDFAEMSQEKQMLILLTQTAEPYEATDYYGHYKKRNETPKRLLRIAPTDGILVPLTGRTKDPKRDSRIIHTGDRK